MSRPRPDYKKIVEDYNRDNDTSYLDIKDLVLAMLPSHSLSDIAREIGVSPSSLNTHTRRSLNIQVPHRHVNFYNERWCVFAPLGYKTFDEAINDLYKKGATSGTLGEMFNIDNDSVLYRLRKNRIKRRPRGGDRSSKKFFETQERIKNGI